MPSNFSATTGNGVRAERKDEDSTHPGVIDGTDTAWPEAKVFTEARTAVWAETEAGVRATQGGKVFTKTEIMTGTGASAEVGAEWGPVDTEGGHLTSMSRDPAAWLGQQKLQTHGGGQQEQAAFSSVLTMLAETAELQAPVGEKPVGLLSKAAWTKTATPSSSKAFSTPSSVKIASSSSSSSSTPASNKDNQITRSDTSAPFFVSSNSSTSNSSSISGMTLE